MTQTATPAAGRAAGGSDPLRLAACGIGAVTVLSGAAQVVAPGFVLRLVGAERTPTSKQLFATVGLFMVVVGGSLTHATLKDSPPHVTLVWAAAQKVGAVAAVGVGTARGVFRPRALAVAGFDLLSAGVVAAYAKRVADRAAVLPGHRGS